MGKVATLGQMGLLNKDWSYDDLVTPQKKKISMAFCSSQRCAGNRAWNGVAKPGQFGVECVHCGSALRYKMVTQEEHDDFVERFKKR